MPGQTYLLIGTLIAGSTTLSIGAKVKLIDILFASFAIANHKAGYVTSSNRRNSAKWVRMTVSTGLKERRL
jgi:hypothetical protein